MSHISIFSLGAILAIDANNSSQKSAREAEARRKAEELILSELNRNFIELVERQEDASGNLKLLLRVNQKAVPTKSGNVEIVIDSNKQTLKVDVSDAPGKACKEWTQPIELILGPPLSIHYKNEYYEGKVPLSKSGRDKSN